MNKYHNALYVQPLVGSSPNLFRLDEPLHQYSLNIEERITSFKQSQEYTEQVAESLGIDLEAEQFLMWIVREHIFTPLPPLWKEIQVSKDLSRPKLVYQNVITREIKDEHPATNHFKSLVDQERKQFDGQFSPLNRGDAGHQATYTWESPLTEQLGESERERQKSDDLEEGSRPPAQSLFGSNQELDGEWQCKFCNQINLANEENCGLCQEARSSEGASSLDTGAGGGGGAAAGAPGGGGPHHQMSEEEWSAFIAAEERRARQLGISNSQMQLEDQGSGSSRLLQENGKARKKKKKLTKPRGLNKLTSERLIYKSSPDLAPPMPAVLEFYSWWTETSAGQMLKRNLTLVYNVVEDNFMVQIEGSDKIYTLSHILGKHGPAGAWDLHVGARLDVLGRRLTLRAAERATAHWLDRQAAWYMRVAEDLEAALRKHGLRPAPGAGATDRLFARERALQAKKARGKGYADLRRLRNEVLTMKGALAELRPQLAQKLVRDAV